MASSGNGKAYAIPILTCESDGKVQVHENALRKIFRRPEVQDKPICIVSISGAFRKGKSFMLNFFIRYLRNKGVEQHADAKVDDVDVLMKDGFDWRGGRKACTNGILMWSEVFIVERDDSDVGVAVILMDTQGLFDHKTDKKTNSIIFALSTLISSVQIFNLSQQIQESDLGFLQFFTEYGKAVLSTSQDKDIKPFQSLTFLVRDWQNPTEFPYGTDGGSKYLEEVLSEESTSEELSSVRKYLRSSFDDTKCCLMPHPGQNVATASKSFKGRLRDIDVEFLRQTASFVDSLFKPQNLVVKLINGQEVSAPALLQYISDCSESLIKGKLPSPKTMMENTAEAQNFEAGRRCHDNYTRAMEMIIEKSFVDDDFLQRSHEKTVLTVMKKFEEMTRSGGEESRKKHRDYLEEAITREYRMLVHVNRNKKAKAEFDVLLLVDQIADEYREKMKKATEGKEFLLDGELDDIHEAHAKEARERYAMDGNTNLNPKEEYFKKLEERLDRIYKALKSENSEKTKIAKQKDEMTRQIMKLQLEFAIQFRKKIHEYIGQYMEKQDLKNKTETSLRMAMDEFQLKALDVPSVKRETLQSHSDELKSKLIHEIELITDIDNTEEEILENSLQSRRSEALVNYEEKFKMLLKDAFMDQEDLRKSHDDVVGVLLSSMRSDFKEYSHLRTVQKCLQDTKDDLAKKYDETSKWNEEKRILLRKWFKRW